MTKLDTLKDRIKKHEGLRLKPYHDTVGVLTIGYGHNLEKGISQRVADLLFEDDFHEAAILAEKIPEYNMLCLARQYVLIEMVFNMGYSGVMKFVNTRKAMADGRFSDAAKGMMNSLWARQVGRRAEFLAEIMETGVFK